MKVIFTILILSATMFTRFCCSPNQPYPESPKSVKGWQKYEHQYVRFIGEFLLKKGQSTDNGKFGVEIVDIIPPKPCVSFHDNAWEGSVRITFKFFWVADNKIICEQTTLNGGNSVLENQCNEISSEIKGIHTLGANPTEGWTHFSLSN